MLETPKIVETDVRLTAVIHLTVTRAEISQVIGPAIEEIITTLTAQGSAPAGPSFSYHWKRPSDTFDFEVGFPIRQPITPAGRVKMSKLPAAKVVRTLYRGSYEGLGVAWGEFCVWMEAEGLRAQESLWESYTVGPASSPDPDQWCTELNRPLAS
jgi:effector-binding domain-containing protein